MGTLFALYFGYAVGSAATPPPKLQPPATASRQAERDTTWAPLTDYEWENRHKPSEAQQ